jgi:hypothetical protein
MPVYISEVTEDSEPSEEDPPSEGSPCSPGGDDGHPGCAPQEQKEVTDVAQSVQKLLEGQQRMEELLGRLVGCVNLDSGEERAGDRPSRPRRVSLSSPRLGAGRARPLSRSGSFEDASPRDFGGPRAWLRDLALRPDLRSPQRELRLGRPSLRTEEYDSELNSIEEDDLDGSAKARAWRGLVLMFRGSPNGEARKPRLVWSPTSPLRLLMDLLSVIVLAYDVISLPYYLAFEVPQEGLVLHLSLISVSFWVVDVAFRFRTGYWHDGYLEMDLTKIARRYLMSSFGIDVSLIALDVISLMLTFAADSLPDSKDAFKLWRLGKVTRVLRCVSVVRLRVLSSLVERLAMQSPTLQATGVVVYDVVKLVCVILWLNHIIACGWISLGRSGISDTGVAWLDTPIGDSEGSTYDTHNTGYQYWTSFHWALTQMTPGSMQVFPLNMYERIFNCVCLIFGVLVFSTLISSISSTVTQFKLSMQRKNAKMEKLNRFLRKVNVDPVLSMQVRKQVQEKLRFQKPLLSKDVETLELLPLSLQVSLQLELCRPHLTCHPLFNFVLEADFLTAEELCQSCVDFSVLAFQDTLFLPGTEAVGMFFVTSGTVTYTLADAKSRTSFHDHMVHRLAVKSGHSVEKGMWLSEAALWCTWRHVGSAEAAHADGCEILAVQANQLTAFLKNRPGSVGLVTSAYAVSFYNFLRASVGEITDLRTPFATDELFASLSGDVRAFMGCVAVRVLKARLKSTRSILASLSEARPDMDKIRNEVDTGLGTIVLAKHDKFGVRRVVTLVAMKLRRADGRLLVALNREQAEAKLPGLKPEDGEHPEQCFRRLLAEHFGPLAEGVAKDGVEREDTPIMQLGIATRVVKVVFHASWEPPAKVVAHVESRRASMDGRRGSVASMDGSMQSQELQEDMLQAEEVVQLPSGVMVSWFTPDELERCGTEAGRRELGRWLSRVSSSSSKKNSLTKVADGDLPEFPSSKNSFSSCKRFPRPGVSV